MRLKCGPDRYERWKIKDAQEAELRRQLKQWHKVFAWFPVRVGPRDCRWLEYVERRLEFFHVWIDSEPRYENNQVLETHYRAIDG